MSKLFKSYFKLHKPGFPGLCFFLLFLFSVTVSQVFALTSCSDGDNEEDITEKIQIDASLLTFEADAESNSTSIEFTALSSWTAAVKETNDWLTVSPTSGIGGIKSISLALKANTNEEARTATVVISSGATTKEISVSQAGSTLQIMDEADVEDFDKYYKPAEFKNINMLRSDAKWSWFRSKQSEHFVVFWEAGFGDNPNASTVDADLRVDIDDLLKKAEQFYKTNVETLKFAEVGQSRSQLDQYKMQIYLFYQTEWLATGAGYDDTIGALWVSPGTCQPVGSTIAHEIGHSFQYQVYCDKIFQGQTNDFTQGFRYGYPGSNGGNGFWEQCAQWQSFQDYPSELFGYHLSVWEANYHRHFEHEWMRYASYWLQYYWAEKHGVEVVSEIWKQSRSPEDALSTYKRLYCNDNTETLYTGLYDYATRMITYDIDGIREYRTSSVGGYTTQLYDAGDNYYQVAYASCPGTTGFNIIPLNTPTGGSTIKAGFEGLSPGSSLSSEDPGSIIDGEGLTVSTTRNYNKNTATTAGWRYGFVAIVNGTPQYAPMNKGQSGTVSYTVPANTSHLYFVVMGAPENYIAHPWNDNESDDAQWPYKVRFEGTDLLGNFEIDTTADPQDVTFTYDITCDAGYADYALGSIDLQSVGDVQKLAQAFVMKPAVIKGNTLDIANGKTSNPSEGKIAFGLQQSDNTYSYSYTANVGFYCTAEGNQGLWSNDDPLFVEYDKDSFVLNYGHKPGYSISGQKYTIKPTLVYTLNGRQYKATFIINMQF